MSIDIKFKIRKFDFPACAEDALRVIENLLTKNNQMKGMDLALDLMAQYVFMEVDSKGLKRSTPLNYIQELQLLNVLALYFSGKSSESAKNTVFLSMFTGNVSKQRFDILAKLVSYAIINSVSEVLYVVSIWMQQFGNTSAQSVNMAERLISDYFTLLPKCLDNFKATAYKVPHFVANFITAAAELYFKITPYGISNPPDLNLLRVTISWVEDIPNFCFSAQQTQPCLPPGAIAMTPNTPLAGLMRWCILAPLHYKPEQVEDLELYSRLNAALLESITEIKVDGPMNAINAQHLSKIAAYLSKHKTCTGSTQGLKQATTRLAQGFQVALSTKCLYGNVQELISQLERLEQDRLLSIIINMHKSK